MGTTRADITGEITSVAASWARESPGFLPASTSFATLRLVSTHLISPPPAGFVHDDNDRKRSECKWRRDEPSQEAEGLGKKITIIDNMIPGTLGNSLGSLLPTGYSLPPVTILGSLSFPSVHSAHDSLSSPFNPLREPLRGRVKRERSGCEERRE